MVPESTVSIAVRLAESGERSRPPLSALTSASHHAPREITPDALLCNVARLKR